jgi:hypothetical protein
LLPEIFYFSSEDERTSEVGVGEEHASKCRLNNVAGSAMAIVAAGNTQYRFNINAYCMVFVVNKENLLYKRQALHHARQASFMDVQTPIFFKIKSKLNFPFIFINGA